MSLRPLGLSLILVATAACGDDAAGPVDATTADTVQLEDTAPPADGAADAAAMDTGAGCADGEACDDGDPCTEDDRCDASGACAGTERTCDDGLTCTIDRCESSGACSHTRVAGFCITDAETPACVAHNGPDPTNPCRVCNATSGQGATWSSLAEGASCNDQDVCTTGEVCELGVCVAKGALDCEAETPCQLGSCDPVLGCTTEDVAGSCDDADPCTLDDACVEGACVGGGGVLDCDDEDPCTLDSCVAGQGCVNDPDALCDDGDSCTDDFCLLGGVCENTPRGEGETCEDGNPCTTGEECDAGGACVGGVLNDCDDENVCTFDSCHPVIGCLHLFADGACDDGAECTLNDTCVAGQCFGVKTNTCDYCPLAMTDKANKIINIELMTDGNPGSGLDVDTDPETCSPPSQCGGGVDNALAPVGFLINESVGESVEQGVVKWVVDLREATFDGEPFTMSIYDSGLTDASAACNFQVDTCEYSVAQLSFDQDCLPYFSFDNAQIINGELVAGGTNSLISMVLPLQGGSLLSMTVAWARVRATYTVVDGRIATLNAVIGGAIPRAQLIAAIEGLDPDDLPLDKDFALELLDALVINDIDLDGDGINESASLGLRINTIPAIIAE